MNSVSMSFKKSQNVVLSDTCLPLSCYFVSGHQYIQFLHISWNNVSRKELKVFNILTFCVDKMGAVHNQDDPFRLPRAFEQWDGGLQNCFGLYLRTEIEENHYKVQTHISFLWCHKLPKFSSLNNINLSSYNSPGQKFRLKSRCLQEALGENPFPCLSQPVESAHIPWLTALSSPFKARNGRLSHFLHRISLTLSFAISSTFKDS